MILCPKTPVSSQIFFLKEDILLQALITVHFQKHPLISPADSESRIQYSVTKKKFYRLAELSFEREVTIVRFYTENCPFLSNFNFIFFQGKNFSCKCLPHFPFSSVHSKNSLTLVLSQLGLQLLIWSPGSPAKWLTGKFLIGSFWCSDKIKGSCLSNAKRSGTGIWGGLKRRVVW